MIVIWLPRSASAPDARIETGTAERSSSPSVTTPRVRSHRCSAPETTVRNTSFTVPPSSTLDVLEVVERQAHPGQPPVRAHRAVQRRIGALTTAFHATSPTPAAASRA